MNQNLQSNGEEREIKEPQFLHLHSLPLSQGHWPCCSFSGVSLASDDTEFSDERLSEGVFLKALVEVGNTVDGSLAALVAH